MNIPKAEDYDLYDHIALMYIKDGATCSMCGHTFRDLEDWYERDPGKMIMPYNKNFEFLCNGYAYSCFGDYLEIERIEVKKDYFAPGEYLVLTIKETALE